MGRVMVGSYGGRNPPPKYGRRYPWDRWLGGRRQVTLRRGREYGCFTYSMAQLVRKRAAERNLTIVLVIADDQDSLWFRVTGTFKGKRRPGRQPAGKGTK